MALLTIEEIQQALPELSDEEATNLITDVEAVAAVYAPCITSPTFPYKAAAKAIIKKAIVYDVESKEDHVKREVMGPFQTEYTTHSRSGTFFSKSQIETLQSLCASATPGMYSIGVTTAW